MFSVRFTPEAKLAIVEQFSRAGFTKPGLMIHRQGPRADVTRAGNGQTEWSVERPHPWRAQVGDFVTFEDGAEDIEIVEGIRVWLAIIPRVGEVGVEVSIQDGELFVETLRA